MKTLLLALLRGYKRWLSPLLGNHCRFYPSCSDYARQAIELHGVLAGSWLALKRLARCQPFCEGGIDPVPGSPQAATAETASRSHRNCQHD